MHDIWLFIHLISVIVGFGAVIVIDVHGLLWILKKRTLKQVVIVAQVTQVLIWIGWLGALVSGFGLINWHWPSNPLLQIKLGLVLMLGLNGVFLDIIKRQFTIIIDNEKVPVPFNIQAQMGIASLISQVGWWGAIIIGFLLITSHLK